MGIDPFLETTDIKQSSCSYLTYLFSYWTDVAFRHTVETRLSPLVKCSTFHLMQFSRSIRQLHHWNHLVFVPHSPGSRLYWFTMFPWIKVPCILASTVGLWATLTPLQPPPAEEEQQSSWKASLDDDTFSSLLKSQIHVVSSATTDDPVYSASSGVSLLPRRQSSLFNMHSTTITFAPIFFDSSFQLSMRNVCVFRPFLVGRKKFCRD